MKSQEWRKTDDELRRLRESGRRLAQVLAELGAGARPGTTTHAIGEQAEALIRKSGGIPVFKGYGAEWGKPFPSAVCVSLNEEVVHGIPSAERRLAEGDLLKLDIGMRFEGMVTDMARTFPVGAVAKDAQTLVDVTRQSLDAGIATLKHGALLSEYATTVQQMVEAHHFSVVRDLVGHGVGRDLHEDPQIPNYFFRGMHDFRFVTGMTVALEPMVNIGQYAVHVQDDGWTFVTKDRSLSAHFEDTVIITEEGTEIVTRPS
jgi:methionyl aminopeptidase